MGAMNNIGLNGYPDYTNRAITKRVDANPLPDDSQMRYSEGDLLFAFRARDTLETDRYTMYALPNLNYFLESAYAAKLRNGRMHNAASLDRPTPAAAAKRKRLLHENIPTTVEEFGADLVRIGPIVSTADKPRVRQRRFGVAVAGRAKVANIWGDVRVNDTVGLCVKEYANTESALVNWEGVRMGPATPGSFLQVRGYWEPDGRVPLHSTVYGRGAAPAEKDIDFVGTKVIAQHRYAMVDAPGERLVDWSAGPAPPYRPLQDDRHYQQGIYIQLGRIIRRTSTPSEDEIARALRTFDGWIALSKSSTVDIHLDYRVLPVMTQ